VAIQETDHTTAPQTSTKDHRLTMLLKDGSMQTLWLSDIRTVEFVDPQLREQLRSYLEVLAAGRQDVTREVSVYPVPSSGPIRVAYLQQFPLWKTSYRLDLGEKENRIQGWAQIDNPTGESWDNVKVSLLSGAPVSFVMNLYDPLYTNRSRVPVPGGQVAAPRQYESSLTTSAASVGEVQLNLATIDAELGRGNGQIQITTRSGTNSITPDQFGQSRTTFQEAANLQVGDFFEYQFPFPVRIASRQSALLPFLQKTLDVERLSIFNGQSDTGNARLGARIVNNTDVPLEAGPVTFFQEGRYAGEAVLDYLPRSDKRLISYGVDYDIQIARKQESKPEGTTRLTVSKGVAVLHLQSVLTTTYEILNRGVDKKTLIIEHPRNSNRKLQGVQPFETTDRFHRFRVALNPGQSTQLVVPETVLEANRVHLEELERAHLLLLTNKQIPQAIRDKLVEIVDLQEQLGKLEDDLKTTQSGIDTLFRDQDRLRENLKALRDTSEDQLLRSRYLDQLKRQEDRIDTSRSHIESVTRERGTAQSTLNDLISNLSFEN
jgi:hypothetical protein